MKKEIKKTVRLSEEEREILRSICQKNNDISMSDYIRFAVKNSNIIEIKNISEVIVSLRSIENDFKQILKQLNQGITPNIELFKNYALNILKIRKVFEQVNMQIDALNTNQSEIWVEIHKEKLSKIDFRLTQQEFEYIENKSRKIGISATKLMYSAMKSENIIIINGYYEAVVAVYHVESYIYQIEKMLCTKFSPDETADIKNIKSDISRTKKELLEIGRKANIYK